MKTSMVVLFCLFVGGVFGNSLSFAQDLGTSPDYTIYPSDKLEVSVYGETELTRELVVRPDGKISFPLIGDVPAAGFSPSQVKSFIDKALSSYIPEASATVLVKELGSLKYYVVGEIGKPGSFNVATELTVLQALALAGGLATYADPSNIIIIRGHGKDTKKIRFDYSEVKKGEKLEQNILLERGDVVLVP